jgi:microcystin-dependent protein
MSEPFVGEIRLMPYTFAPYGWAACDGQLLSVIQYQTLFALIGTTFGGDGTTTFGVPDLRARTAIGFGNGPGLTHRAVGQTGGENSVTLNINQLPPHTHVLQASSAAQSGGVLTNALFANLGGRTSGYASYAAGPNVVSLNNASIQSMGSSQSHENRQPFLAVQYCIATEGIFPVRP